MTRRGQTGMAVVVALLLVALAASTAALMLFQHDLWARQVEGLAARAQADAAARAGIDAVHRTLAEGANVATVVSPDRIREVAEAATRALSVGGITLEVAYADPQARFNLNNLVRGDRASEADVRVFQRLLELVKLTPDLAFAIVDAIDGDSETSLPGGAEDLDYLAMDPPRRAANRAILDAAQIVRLKGFSPDATARLMPLITALPGATSVNVNSVPAEAFTFIVNGLDESAARKLAAARDETPFRDLGAFRAQLPEGATPAPGLALSVTSRYLTLVSRARIGRTQVAYEALIGLPGAAQTGVIWRKQVAE